MHIPDIDWPTNLTEAQNIQKELQNKVKIEPLKESPRFIAAVDSAFTNNHVVAVAVLFTYPALEFLEKSFAVKPLLFPYVPGYLTFREGPGALKAIGQLKNQPDLILFDGQGIAHPRGMGIASHLGVLLDIPAIGSAKSKLVGSYDEPGPQKGDYTPLLFREKTIGAALRTRPKVKPIFVSPGHRIDIDGSIRIVLNCTQKYKLPEPIRKADSLTKVIKKSLPAGKLLHDLDSL